MMIIQVYKNTEKMLNAVPHMDEFYANISQ